MLELNKIYNTDVLEGLKALDDDSVDLIITSPPYNLGAKHHTGSNHFKSYCEYNDDMPEELYHQWQIEFLDECYRILKSDGSMWYNHKNRIRNGIQITPYEWILKSKFAHLVKQEIVWFNRSQNFDKCRFYPMTERIYWFAKNPKTRMFNAINHHDVFDTKDWQPVGTKGEFKRAYPEKMVEDIISCFESANIILNPFSGSGTTCAVAKKMGKSYIGFEISKEYCDIAEQRIAELKGGAE
jgi:modification methylase